jgi:hypothetical protein
MILRQNIAQMRICRLVNVYRRLHCAVNCGDFGFCLGANGCVAGNCVDETCEFECALAVVGEEEKILGTQLGLECHELRRCAPAREDAGFLFRQ